MKAYKIEVFGCDDSTVIYDVFSDMELEVIKRLAVACNEASHNHCQPTISIEGEDGEVIVEEKEYRYRED